jgi:hypothetical protein
LHQDRPPSRFAGVTGLSTRSGVPLSSVAHGKDDAMKVAIIGAGAVGCACLTTLVARGGKSDRLVAMMTTPKLPLLHYIFAAMADRGGFRQRWRKLLLQIHCRNRRDGLVVRYVSSFSSASRLSASAEGLVTGPQRLTVFVAAPADRAAVTENY